ncbi:hypothetical protein DPMN_092712 [Dreissena polymorpha]|uniref:Uncharacterized protein n=1 Tax=Dreissena polymorpha TaxID=45954 RepID=A0A9D4R0F3_DREPO|nr:hypothetical protein DPMN_092712 [Dreissena polymorpha]
MAGNPHELEKSRPTVYRTTWNLGTRLLTVESTNGDGFYGKQSLADLSATVPLCIVPHAYISDSVLVSLTSLTSP